MANAPPPLSKFRVHMLRTIADGIVEIELRSNDVTLAQVDAGSHINLHLPGGLIRSYSLINPNDVSGRYLLAVALDATSRGGSSYIHTMLHLGDMIGVSGPRNNFPLAQDNAPSVLIAGGIGITPIWAMIQQLETLGREWTLFYAARTRRGAAYLDMLLERYSDKVTAHIDEETGGIPDITSFIDRASADAHLYCCGPEPMLDAFEAATATRAPDLVHLERFKGNGNVAVGGFTVVLASSGASYLVAEGSSILDTLLDAGLDIAHSCADGICGTCLTKVVAGIPDHRDGILTKEERASNEKMLICVSGCKGDRLILDL